MLKALELVGFKSFADRTRFDFPDGITVVVGPNGSGKSNVVDAVKWVLGAQSAKALRGVDMADVIFKGSAEGGRKPANSAEVVLILDNSKRTFGLDADEVHVSRRVFRSGEGEYAINNQPCRLKDVKDLFRGTGVGVDAYSLIEQGKVDRLLQASPKDRRGIFEEAAGISRFKAKKVEAERRLVRVDQNMLRLGDIVDELGKRLTTLQNQAAKANRYRELNLALQTKRQQLGWIDRMALQHERQQVVRQLESAHVDEAQFAQLLAAQQEIVASEQTRWQELQVLQESAHKEYLAAQRDLASAESGQTASIERGAELLAEQTVLQERIMLLEKRASLSSDEIAQKESELALVDAECGAAQVQLKQNESKWSELQSELFEVRKQLESTKTSQHQIREDAAKTHSQLTAYHLHVEQLDHSIQQLQNTFSQTQNELREIESELLVAAERYQQAVTASEYATDAKREAEDRVQRHRLSLMNAQEQLISIQGKTHGVRERLLVLEQLEDQFTGAGRGGQQLLRLARENRRAEPGESIRNLQGADLSSLDHASSIVSNVWDTVIGLVADLLTTELHLAPLIDVALGTHSDAIVLSNGQIVDWINNGNYSIDGRVTLIRMDRLASRRSGEKIQLDGLRGVLGRADRMTRFDQAYEPLVRFLLGNTWFVDTLSTALELSHFRGAGLRFVTAECQLVESDGSITLGSLQTGLGLVSRRSEMQSAREEIRHLEESISNGVAVVANAQSAIVESEALLRVRDLESHEAERNRTALELRLESVKQRREKLVESLATDQQNVDTTRNRLAEVQSLIEKSVQSLEQFASMTDDIDSAVGRLTAQYADCEQRMQSEQSVVTERRIQMARIEQRMVGLRITMEQMQHDSAERARNVTQAVESLRSIETRIASNRNSVSEFQLRAEAARGAIEALDSQRAEFATKVQAQNTALQSATRAFDTARRSLEKGQDRIQVLQTHRDQLSTQWDVLRDHYAHEFQLDLDSLAEAAEQFIQQQAKQGPDSSPVETIDPHLGWIRELIGTSADSNPGPSERSRIESDISHLRQEIAASGGVNMEALAELDELQTRYGRLSNHHRDLDDAKTTLIKTMNKIDEDSRDMFLNTLAAIRTNFQDLYRRSFGGGFADIVLEDEQDPDSGIEIIATPPGKTTLSNTLLSGGEKALTAVALIMAFFQYRPSPFCILDEVDAPFDEANIGRFVTVLREFLDSTKFIVVTHSKKTMTAANMIYGITMQESGVSRQVSVRFEEVDDRGEIIQQRRAA
ncbi:MAG: chromosome segregation protein SMC [Pirellula sp.]